MSTLHEAAQATFEERYRAAVRDLETAANVSRVMAAEHAFRIAEVCEQRDALKAELAAEHEMQSALQEQMSRHAEMHVREVAEAREEQREACARQYDIASWDPQRMAEEAAFVRATPLAATPLRERIAELETNEVGWKAALSIKEDMWVAAESALATEKAAHLVTLGERDAARSTFAAFDACARERNALHEAHEMAKRVRRLLSESAESERDALKARVAELARECDVRMKDIIDQQRRAEAAEARAKEAEEQAQMIRVSEGVQFGKAQRMEAERDALKARVASLTAQSASMRAEAAEARVKELEASRNRWLEARWDSAGEVRAARKSAAALREALEGIRAYVRVTQPLLKTRAEFMDAFALLNGASLPAPDAEPKCDDCDNYAGIRVCTGCWEKHRGDLMAVAERVREACVAAFVEPGAPKENIRALDLASLLANPSICSAHQVRVAGCAQCALLAGPGVVR